MVEDRLTHDERLRLEALNQTIAWGGPMRELQIERVLESAAKVETFLRDGRPDAD